MEEICSVGYGIIFGIEPWCDKDDFTNFTICIFREPAYEESPAATVTDEYCIWSDIKSFELFFPELLETIWIG